MEMRAASQMALLLLALAAGMASSATWDEERLQWLVVTKPGEMRVQLNCTSEHIYPFTLLNDSSRIGAVGSLVKRIWWLLPDGRQVNDSYDDGNRRAEDRGVSLSVRQVDDSVNGLYHCVAEAVTMINDTTYDYNRTTVYFYKRGLNLYGMDLYGGNSWEKYRRNTLIGSLTAGVFLALVAGYALLDRFGVLAKCSAARSNTVDTLDGGGGVADGGSAAEAAEMAGAPMPAASPAGQSRASVRSRRSDRPDQETPA